MTFEKETVSAHFRIELGQNNLPVTACKGTAVNIATNGNKKQAKSPNKP